MSPFQDHLQVGVFFLASNDSYAIPFTLDDAVFTRPGIVLAIDIFKIFQCQRLPTFTFSINDRRGFDVFFFIGSGG